MRTIKVKKWFHVVEEMTAHATITPGMLVEQRSDGKIQAHSKAVGNAVPMFALEDELQGKTIADNYAAGDPVQVWIPQRGEQVYAHLAAGQNVAVGTFLSSNGAGMLRATPAPASTGDVDVLEIVGVAVEAVNASAGAKRIIIRVV